MRVAFVLTLLLLALQIGCAEPVGPIAGPAVYDLESVDGRTLPAPWPTSGGQLAAVEGTISFQAWRPRLGSAIATTLLTFVTADGDTLRTETDRGFTVSGMQLRFGTCPRDAICPAVLRPFSIATLEGNRLTFRAEPGQPELVYRRR